MALSKAKLLAGQFRRSDADDADTFAASWGAVMAEFPPIVLDHVCHPAKGIASQQSFLPSVFEVRESCIAVFETMIAKWRLDQIPPEKRRQITQRATAQAQIEQAREKRPSYDELKAKYGENWGLSSVDPRRERKDDYKVPTVGEIVAHYTKNGLGIPLHRPMKEESNGQEGSEEEAGMADALASGRDRQESERGRETAEAGVGFAPGRTQEEGGTEADQGQEPDLEDAGPWWDR